MAKKSIRTKSSFGSVAVDHISPPKPQGQERWPDSANIVLSFEEALKLHLGLGELLGHLNGYDRSTKHGKQAAANLCLFFPSLRITINEDRTKP